MSSLHDWPWGAKQALKLQAELRDRLVLLWDGREIDTVGGVDVGIQDEMARAAIIVMRYPDLTPVEGAAAQVPVRFPYIPGLLAFREGPAVVVAWEKLQTKPELLLFDGQGIAHPRGIGIASHMGLWFERPTIGVAKSRLYGYHDPPGRKRGDSAMLRDQRDPDRVIGSVLRTRTDVKPVYVSPGHLTDVSYAVEVTLRCCTRYRLPEPIRWAHRVAGGQNPPTKASPQ